jgi:lysine/ornithine N-monooxygenase
MPRGFYRKGMKVQPISFKLMNCAYQMARFKGRELYRDWLSLSDAIKSEIVEEVYDELYSYYGGVSNQTATNSIKMQITFHILNVGGKPEDMIMRKQVKDYVYFQNKY